MIQSSYESFQQFLLRLCNLYRLPEACELLTETLWFAARPPEGGLAFDELIGEPAGLSHQATRSLTRVETGLGLTQIQRSES